MPAISSKDLLDKLDNYHHEIVAFAQQTTQNVQTLKDATDVVNRQKDTFWTRAKAWIPVILILLAIIGVLLMKPAGVCQVSISADKGLQIQSCEQNNSSKN